MSGSVVFVSPVCPSFRGNGLAMRAAATLHLLSKWWPTLHLLVIPSYHADRVPDAEIANLCKSWHVAANPVAESACPEPLSEWQRMLVYSGLTAPEECFGYNAAWQDNVSKIVDSLSPDLLLVYRFYLFPFVFPAARNSVPIWLDMDEMESNSRARLSDLYGVLGKRQLKAGLKMDAEAYRQLESHYLPRFQRVFAGSHKEAQSVLSVCPNTSLRIMPNVYPAILPQPTRKPDGAIRFLYVGSFRYYPNYDAINYFCADILPSIRRRCLLPIEVSVVGTGLEPGEMDDLPGVTIIGPVPDTTPFYASCDAAIVPLRAAGGTRIKILEAFSHRRAVVSTTIGAEGLEVTPGVHLGIADTPETFADLCLNLIDRPDERDALAASGHDFFRKRHTLSQVESMLPQLFG